MFWDNDSLNMGPYMALIVPNSFYGIDAGLHALSFSLVFNVHKLYFKINTIIYRNISYLLMNFITCNESWNVLRLCIYIVYIYNQKSENIDFKGLAEVINKLIFNNLHNPPPTKYFYIIINPLYSENMEER
jgi:hypothetical protein